MEEPTLWRMTVWADLADLVTPVVPSDEGDGGMGGIGGKMRSSLSGSASFGTEVAPVRDGICGKGGNGISVPGLAVFVEPERPERR